MLKHNHSRKNAVGRLITHEGRLEDCTNHVCRRWASQIQQRGVWCPHGKQITEEVPAEHTCDTAPFSSECSGCYPDERFVEPWPCSQCSREKFEERYAAAEVAYQEFLWEEHWALINAETAI